MNGSANGVWQPGDAALPALFLGHGAPPLLDDPVWPRELAAWAADLPKPRAILMVSAHWEDAPLAVSNPAAGTPLVYDFYGFPRRYYQLTYASGDAQDLAAMLDAVLPDRMRPVRRTRGLDHGAWVPLLPMYPDADIPVLQLSLPTQDPDALLALGGRLRPLREEGVLIVGSGFLTHGLPFLRPQDWAGTAPPPGWSRDFDAWADGALRAGDVSALADYRSKAPGMPYAHPTVEHFIPLFVALGAGDDPEAPVTTTVDGFFLGLSKRSFQTAAAR